MKKGRINWHRRDAWIGVFDILGFKELIRQTDREFPRALLTSKLDDLVKSLESDAVKIGSLDYLILSDTFIIIAPDLEPKSYPWFLQACRALITNSIYVELPLRSAISIGPIFLSKEPAVIIGSAFLEAYEYCARQDWIGLLLTPSATQALRKSGLEPTHHDFVAGGIPMKDDNVLAYRFQTGQANFENPLLKHLEQMRHFAPDFAKHKYENTVAFIRQHDKRISQ